MRIGFRTASIFNTTPIDIPATFEPLILKTHSVHTPTARPSGRDNTNANNDANATNTPGITEPISNAPNNPNNAPNTSTPHT